jgi:hypothetical protein
VYNNLVDDGIPVVDLAINLVSQDKFDHLVTSVSVPGSYDLGHLATRVPESRFKSTVDQVNDRRPPSSGEQAAPSDDIAFLVLLYLLL